MVPVDELMKSRCVFGWFGHDFDLLLNHLFHTEHQIRACRAEVQSLKEKALDLTSSATQASNLQDVKQRLENELCDSKSEAARLREEKLKLEKELFDSAEKLQHLSDLSKTLESKLAKAKSDFEDLSNSAQVVRLVCFSGQLSY